MAKSSLPSVDGNATTGPQQKQSDVPDVGSPYPHEDRFAREVYAKQLTRSQGRKLIAKCRELMDSGATLENGKHVTNKSMVVKWLIENHC